MIYFLVYLFIEIFVSYEFATIFTPFGLFLEIILSFLVGMFLLRFLNFSLVESMQKVSKREISQEEFISIGMFKFVGAILLIIPGVFTDIIGLLMQFDFVGKFVARRFLPSQKTNNQHNDDIIDVEIIENK
jgi:UPF0716 family protein affecting phage T7 exclusion